MGLLFFIENSVKAAWYKLKKRVCSILPALQFKTLESIAKQYNISVDYTGDPNSEAYLYALKLKEPDFIIKQSQFILKDDFLELTNIGILNHHNVLVPKNRGRLTPFLGFV